MLWLLLAGAAGYAMAPDEPTVIVQEAPQQQMQPVQQQQQQVIIIPTCLDANQQPVNCPPEVIQQAIKQQQVNNGSQ